MIKLTMVVVETDYSGLIYLPASKWVHLTIVMARKWMAWRIAAARIVREMRPAFISQASFISDAEPCHDGPAARR